MDDTTLTSIAGQLTPVEGVVAVALGGSRARGEHRPDSDVDLGLYYRGELDTAALRTLADEIADEPVEITAPGMVAATGRLPAAPSRFAERTHALLAGVGGTADAVTRTVAEASALVSEVRD
ncbi:MAG: nucleotidyltransferase domain-containing protein, partial [Micromonosporaceae bacterium]